MLLFDIMYHFFITIYPPYTLLHPPHAPPAINTLLSMPMSFSFFFLLALFPHLIPDPAQQPPPPPTAVSLLYEVIAKVKYT